MIITERLMSGSIVGDGIQLSFTLARRSATGTSEGRFPPIHLRHYHTENCTTAKPNCSQFISRQALQRQLPRSQRGGGGGIRFICFCKSLSRNHLNALHSS
jgi:hypothetical protein